jgi:hypothetical protein
MHIIQRIKDSYEFLAAVAIIIFLTDLEEGVTSEGQRPWYKEVLLFFEVVGLSMSPSFPTTLKSRIPDAEMSQ